MNLPDTRDLFIAHGFPVEFYLVRCHDKASCGLIWDGVKMEAGLFLKRTRLGQTAGHAGEDRGSNTLGVSASRRSADCAIRLACKTR